MSENDRDLGFLTPSDKREIRLEHEELCLADEADADYVPPLESPETKRKRRRRRGEATESSSSSSDEEPFVLPRFFIVPDHKEKLMLSSSSSSASETASEAEAL